MKDLKCKLQVLLTLSGLHWSMCIFSGWGFGKRKRLVLLLEIGIIYANTGMTVPVEMTEECTESLAYPAALQTVIVLYSNCKN